jgi:vancomycin permeability regulator SanA
LDDHGAPTALPFSTRFRSIQRGIPLSRLDHRRRLWLDRDAPHTGTVAGIVCVLSVGLAYLGYFAHVVRTARRASCMPERGECVLLFGKHSPDGRPDADFSARIARTAALLRAQCPRMLVLLGGGAPGHPSEAEIAHAALLAEGICEDTPLRLETRSRDTLQNLRNARTLLRDSAHHGPVTLISSRYHLARCALFANQLGFDWELCAAEPELRWSPTLIYRLAGEAAYVCWIDLGTRWARLIGHRRMLARVT